MNNYIKIIFSIYLTVNLGNCQIINTTDIQSSSSIEFSKSSDLFLEEYKIDPINLVINGENFTISKSWIESSWKYDNDKEIEIFKDRLQLIIQLKPGYKNYLKNWILSLESESKCFGQQNNNLVASGLSREILNKNGIIVQIGFFDNYNFKERENRSNIILVKN